MLWDIKQKLRSTNSKIRLKIPQLFDSSNMKIKVSEYFIHQEMRILRWIWYISTFIEFRVWWQILIFYPEPSTLPWNSSGVYNFCLFQYMQNGEAEWIQKTIRVIKSEYLKKVVWASYLLFPVYKWRYTAQTQEK